MSLKYNIVKECCKYWVYWIYTTSIPWHHCSATAFATVTMLTLRLESLPLCICHNQPDLCVDGQTVNSYPVIPVIIQGPGFGVSAVGVCVWIFYVDESAGDGWRISWNEKIVSTSGVSFEKKIFQWSSERWRVALVALVVQVFIEVSLIAKKYISRFKYETITIGWESTMKNNSAVCFSTFLWCWFGDIITPQWQESKAYFSTGISSDDRRPLSWWYSKFRMNATLS